MPPSEISRTRPTLNLIGPGRLGQTLARLWVNAGLADLRQIVGRSDTSVSTASAFIGAGSGARMATLQPADLTLVAVPDDQLEAIAAELAQCPRLAPGAVVFHCSGSRPSELLAASRQRGAAIASVHPLKSFARPELAVQNFAGTWCGCEGDAAALAVLRPLFTAVGGICFDLDGSRKTLYHAGAVLACNHLAALMEAALRAMEAAGVAREQAWPALRPLIAGSLDNIDRLGTAGALTGPIARGDAATVTRHIQALSALAPLLAANYRELSKIALQLAGGLAPERRDALAACLDADLGPAGK
ncbi:MAG: DUF2520 domain-containing protein [Rhodocyclaceae bacterium]|nr:DUF2520 domain-containing protein [Rhodocyclaceae bacterium]MBX3667233.1 DUF2520 domain-containing protein [Rhodocyclaceae bacterium]